LRFFDHNVNRWGFPDQFTSAPPPKSLTAAAVLRIDGFAAKFVDYT